MKNALQCIKGPGCGNVHVVDGKLILSFPNALTPVVWQMDLAQTKASSLEVMEKDGGKTHALLIKTPKGETLEVALFAKKSQAVNGLVAASRALSTAHGQIRAHTVAGSNDTGENYTVPARKKGFSWKTFMLGILMLFILMTVWASLTPPTAINESGDAGLPVPAPEAETGVPLSADEYLRNR
ncbi:MAG: hypothetical protein ACT4OY_06630 [Alphaproteobacteria bacterium]